MPLGHAQRAPQLGAKLSVPMHTESGACEHGLEGIGRAERSEHGRPPPVPSRREHPLINMRGRWYDAATRRFLTRDPIVSGASGSQGWNPYSYVHNRPFRFVDPTGYQTTCTTGSCYDDRRGADGVIEIVVHGKRQEPPGPPEADAREGLSLQSFGSASFGSSAPGEGPNSGMSTDPAGQPGVIQLPREWEDPAVPVQGFAPKSGGNQLLDEATKQIEDTSETWQAAFEFQMAVTPFGAEQFLLKSLGWFLGKAAARLGTKAAARAVPQLGTRGQNLLQAAKDPRLRDAVRNLFRSGAKVGDGSTMAAVRYERATGQLLSPKGHTQKLLDRRGQLQKLWSDRGLSAGDRQIVKELLGDIQDALGGL